MFVQNCRTNSDVAPECLRLRWLGETEWQELTLSGVKEKGCDPGSNASTISPMNSTTKKSAAASRKTKASRRAPRPASKTAHKKPPHSIGKRAPRLAKTMLAKTQLAKTKAAARGKAKLANMKKKPTPVHAKPRGTEGTAGPRSGDSDRGIYVRFGPRPQGIAVKKNVQAFVDELGISMNEYIVAATLNAIKDGWKPDLKPEAVASPGKESAEARKTA